MRREGEKRKVEKRKKESSVTRNHEKKTREKYDYFSDRNLTQDMRL